ncbi:hypothetical protein ACFZDJ_26535 [Streptomyces sp. NPDC007896]|uniref:hypothetical protein n=1 Tax=Streptomyces sp. NPDC007896 TaxID=3364784 RepID=UPI0036E6EF8F
MGRLTDGTAFAVVPQTEDAAGGWAEFWPLVAACEPSIPRHGGIGSPAAGPQDLNGALSEARYALASARTTAPDFSSVVDSSSLTGLDTLLTGIRRRPHRLQPHRPGPPAGHP